MKPSSSSDRASELCWGGCGDARSIQRGLLCHTERTPSLTAQTGINSQEARATLLGLARMYTGSCFLVPTPGVHQYEPQESCPSF